MGSGGRRHEPRARCEWAAGNPLLKEYHDKDWGVPQHDDRALFEFLTLEGAQAGLSWLTILQKRKSFRRAFDAFEPRTVARYGPKKVASLLADDGVIRNRLKIESTIRNAQRFLDLEAEFGSFDKYVWRFVGGKPRMNGWKNLGQIPAKTEESDALSSDLRHRGFSFVGSTICYAFMQAVGMVNDHVIGCFRYAELTTAKARGPKRRRRSGVIPA